MRWLFRGPAPAADRLATELEAQRAYHAAVDEARLERIAELERALEAANTELAHAKAALAGRGVEAYFQAGLRARRRLAEEPTVAVSHADMLRAWRSTVRGGRVR